MKCDHMSLTFDMCSFYLSLCIVHACFMHCVCGIPRTHKETISSVIFCSLVLYSAVFALFMISHFIAYLAHLNVSDNQRDFNI